MKNYIKYLLQRLLGFKSYLFLFSLFKIKTLRSDKKENDFFFFLNLIPENAIVLDIGANLGIMTVHLAKKVIQGKVFAFEPIPDNVEILTRMVSYFDLQNVKVFDFALGDKNDTLEMVMPVMGAVKMQGLSHVVHPDLKDFNEGNKFSIEARTLDSVLAMEFDNQKISAIKIDVENFEYFVLKGGEQLIKKFKPLIYIELWDNENRQKCFDFLRKMGYSVNVIEKGKLVRFDEKRHHGQNFICN